MKKDRRGSKCILRKYGRKISNTRKQTDIQVQEAQRVSKKMNLDRHTVRQIKWQKQKRESKGSKEKKNHVQRNTYNTINR